MEILLIPLAVLVVIWTNDILNASKTKKEKSVEEQLGEALGKYLGKGVKINVHIGEDKDKKDKDDKS
ncbi:MAG: hypothetical protein ACFE0I_00320 [Elainellaceae cyanobacterium]